MWTLKKNAANFIHMTFADIENLCIFFFALACEWECWIIINLETVLLLATFLGGYIEKAARVESNAENWPNQQKPAHSTISIERRE